MPRYHLTFECDWERRKLDLASNILKRELSFLGGVSNVTAIVPLGDTPAEPPKPRFRLTCSYNGFGKGRCGQVWESDVFTACPKCGNRKWVKRAEEAA